MPSSFRVPLAAASVALFVVTLAACSEDSVTLSGQPIVSGIPWQEREETQYRLVDGDDIVGSGILRIESAAGETTFTQDFESEEFTDVVVATVDALTLRPVLVDRLIEGPEGPRRWEVEYLDSMVKVFQESEEDERRDELSAPSNSYDSWTDIFLWRTIDFSEGFEAEYTDVLTATLAKPEVISQTLKVTRQEMVEVPAGSFQAWRLEISSSGGTQTAWYADTPARTMVRYDNGNLVFELVTLE